MRTCTLLGGVWLCSMAAGAADTFDIKPGLWNMSSSVEMNGLPPMPNLDKMSPEQRARIEAAMKNMSGRTNTTKICVTRQNIESAIAQANSDKSNACSPKLISMSASKVELHVDCTQENRAIKSNGEWTIERQDSEHVKGTGAMKSTGANGRTMDMKWSMTGAYVSSDCGDVKPNQ